LLALLVFFFLSRKTVSEAAPALPPSAGGVVGMVSDAFSSRWALLGGAAIFLYVGAEVAIGTQMALFLNSGDIWGNSDAAFAVPFLGNAMGSDGIAGVSLQEAGKAVSFYWGGAMIGRAIGSVLLARFNAARMLAAFTALAAALCLYVVLIGGASAGFVALSIGLFNSIMFPVIFTLTLERSSASAEATSGLLCTAIVGGAFLPLVAGAIADETGLAMAFLAPAACYIMLCVFAFSASKVRQTRSVASASPH
jgi:FHS family L-fucose permease-like MFS transporter